MDFHHIGVPTEDAAELAELYSELFEMPVVHEEQIEDKTIVFLELDTGGYVELLEQEGEGNITNYLEEHGPGIHHFAYETDDIEAALENARALGVDLIDEEPRPGSWGSTIAFLDPDLTGGVLFEFVEE